jgi:hypothetical protein
MKTFRHTLVAFTAILVFLTIGNSAAQVPRFDKAEAERDLWLRCLWFTARNPRSTSCTRPTYYCRPRDGARPPRRDLAVPAASAGIQRLEGGWAAMGEYRIRHYRGGDGAVPCGSGPGTAVLESGFVATQPMKI